MSCLIFFLIFNAIYIDWLLFSFIIKDLNKASKFVLLKQNTNKENKINT